MKNTRWLLFAALAGFWTVSSHAQVIIFSGHITSTTGLFAGQFADGDPVSLSLDFTNSTDLLHGRTAGSATYLAPYKFSIAGELFPLLPPTEPVLVANLINGSGMQGLLVNQGYFPDHNGVPDPNGRYIYQPFLTTQDVGVTRSIFPEGIPFDKFSVTDGMYSTSILIDNAYRTTGTINWRMESYVGALALPDLPDPPPPPPPINPVPEPATYGLFATLGLTVLVAYRRYQAALRTR